MLRFRSSRLAGVAGAVLLLAALAAFRALAQAEPPDAPEELRAGIDENLPDGGQAEVPRPGGGAAGRLRKDAYPPGSGAGHTGFVSTNVARPASEAVKENFDGRAVDEPIARRKKNPAREQRGAARRGAMARPGNAANAATASPGKTAAPGAAGPDLPDAAIAAKQRQRRKPAPEEDPFAAIGIRAGAFVLRPALELSTGYDSNPARTTDARGSALFLVAPELKVDSDWERHELTANVRASYSDYPSVPFADRPFLDAKVDGRIDATRNLRVDLQTRYYLSTENPGSPNLQAGLAKLPIYTDIGATAGIDRRFNRLDISLKGTIDRFDYQDSLLTDGTTASNKDRNYDQYGVKARAGYEISPGLKPFVELDADRRLHDLAVDQSGFARDSDGVTPKAGAAFELTRKLTGEISIGYLVRTYKDPRLADLRGLIMDSSLVWTATALTTVKLTATSAADESMLPGVSGLLRRDLGIQVDHAFRRWLVGTVKFGWGLDDYVGLDRTDRRYGASLAILYKLSRHMQLKGELREYWLRSNVTGADYTATMILVGLRLQR